MAPAQRSFSPEEILDAARQAEARGNTDYAAQLYRHLTDHFATTAPAAEAEAGLARLTGAARARPSAGSRPRPPPPPQAIAAPAPAPDGLSPAVVRRPGQESRALVRRAQARRPDAGHDRRHLDPDDEEGPSPSRRYRVGRLLTSILGLTGWLMVLASLAVPVAAILFSGRGAAGGTGIIQGFATPVVAITLLVGGLGVVLVSELARALFDLANTSRDLAALQRHAVPWDGERGARDDGP